MKNKLYFPFRVSYSGKTGSKHNFLVNAGDINSFIFNTYKVNFLENSLNKNSFNAVNYLNLSTFEYTEEWRSTFSSNESCDVYLTIPKIPAAFEDNRIPDCFYNKGKPQKEKIPITINNNKYEGPDWWRGTFPNDFINQFKIVTSNEQGFQSDYDKNILYTEENNNYENLKGIVLTNDSEFPGKIYIKLATITIDNNNINIKRYFQSNVISPTKYIRLGALPIRNIRILYSTVSRRTGEAWIVRSSSDVVAYPGLAGVGAVSGGGEHNNPLLFFKKIPKIKELVVEEIKNIIRSVNNKYFYGAFYSGGIVEAISALHNQRFKLQDLTLYQVVIMYKETLGEKWIIERIYNDTTGAQAIINSVNAQGAALIAMAADVAKANDIRGIEIFGDAPTSVSLPDALSKNNIIETMLMKQQITQPKLINLNVNDLLEFKGFEDEEGN